MLKNISRSSQIIGALGLITILVMSLASGIDYLSIITLVGGLTGFASVVLIVNRSWWAGAMGIISAVSYIYVALFAQNPSDAILNVLFLLALDLPIVFNKDWQEDTAPKSITGKQGLILFAIFVVAFLGLHFMEAYILNTPRAIWSPLAASLGITASVSTSFMRVKQSFIIWTAQNVLQVILWSITAYVGDATWTMAIVYMFYTLNAGSSFFNGKWFTK